MIGHTYAADIPYKPLDPQTAMGAGHLYADSVRAPYILVPQNLRVSNKPSETNVVNAVGRIMVPQQVPGPQQTGFGVGKVLSHYIFLPAGKDTLRAQFGST